MPLWQRRLGRLVTHPAFELSIGGVIVVSVALTLIENALPPDSVEYRMVDQGNFFLTTIMIVELCLRYAAATSKAGFFREYWIDILSVLPVLRPLRVFRAFRLLRLLRIFRLMGLFSRYVSLFPYVVRRGAVEYLIVSGLVLLTVLFGSSVMLAFERGDNQNLDELSETFWFSVYTLFAGEPIPGPAQTVLGHLASVFIMFMGMTVFAMLTGTVSAFMVERLRLEGHYVNWDKLEDHIIICGWNRKAETIIREYEAAGPSRKVPIVAISDIEVPPDLDELGLAGRVTFLNEDFTNVATLEKARVSHASTCIILADLGHGRSERDADARTILAALTVEKLNANVYTCAELNNREYGSHLEMGHVNNYVLTNDQSALLLAQAALNRGMISLFGELLTYQRGNQFYTLEIPNDWAGKPFFEIFVMLKQEHAAIAIAVHTADGTMNVNPGEYELRRGDSLIIISDHEIKFE